MDSDIKYITEHFIDSDELCKITKISEKKLAQLIEKKLIPGFSYQIETQSIITSPLGDKQVISNVKKYFSKNVVDLIKQNLNLENQDLFKEKIKKEFIEAFSSHKYNSFGYDNIIQKDGSINYEKLDEAFEIEWKHYLNGIYGICTLNATGTEIAKKEIAVKKLIAFIDENNEIELSEVKKQELIELNSLYNEVSKLFSPYQRKNSSRGKYLDKILDKSSLSELIKNYN